MFQRLPEVQTELTFYFDGQPIAATIGDSVAAALLGAGITVIGMNRVSNKPCAPRCLIGTCFECLVEIEGKGRYQACLVQARDGMRVRRIVPDEGVTTP